MAASLQPIASGRAPTQLGGSAGDSLAPRRSNELVVGLSGPVGCGIAAVADELEQALKKRNYTVVRIKVSDHFPDLASRLGLIPSPDVIRQKRGFDRYDSYQNVGNDLRARLGQDLAGQLAAIAIFKDRAKRHPGEVAEITPDRTAYIIDQLKHPAEANLLREIYGDLFFLLGVLCGYRRRLTNLQAHMDESAAAKLMSRDKAEADTNGQQLDKTLQLSDYFIRNSHSNTIKLSGALTRFLDLAHGGNGITPTRKEFGMYEAFSASLNSACLSRQVGAAILDTKGNLLSTGCNDVPRAGGSLYREEHKPDEDHRCVFFEGGRCFNQQRKDAMREEIARTLSDAGVPQADTLASQIRSNTGMKDLIEFSRSVHAEMDAIVSVARTGCGSTKGAVLFTTTYPCHNCARHIVAAGITAVYFIEPYDKSLAEKLHHDAIDHEPEHDPEWGELNGSRVSFIHFEGVAPNRYKELFMASSSRKDAHGRPIHPSATPDKKMPAFLDNYRELEGRVLKRLQDAGYVDLADARE